MIGHLIHSRKVAAGITAGALVVVILLVVVFAGMRGGPMRPGPPPPGPTPGPQQPNIQVTAINILQNIVEHPPVTVLEVSRVSNSFNFDAGPGRYYVGPGTYSLVFDNRFSSATMNVSVSLVAGEQSSAFTVFLASGLSVGYGYDLSANQWINGTFTLTGGSPNDIGFRIAGQTCTHTIGFNFTLVNSGTANGLATVSLQGDGTPYWQQTYLVAQGQNLPESGYLFISDCTSHTYNLQLSALRKA